MRLSILFLIFTTSVNVFSSVVGTPDQDPVIKALIERFKKAKEPKGTEIINKKYSCREMDAYRDSFKKTAMSGLLSFERFDGLLVKKQKNTLSNGVILIGNGYELIGTTQTSSSVHSLAYRIETNGNLIGEWTDNTVSSRPELTPVSAASGDAKVISYSLCVPKW